MSHAPASLKTLDIHGNSFSDAAKEQNKGAASLMAVGVAGKLMSGIKKKRAGGD